MGVGVRVVGVGVRVVGVGVRVVGVCVSVRVTGVLTEEQLSLLVYVL